MNELFKASRESVGGCEVIRAVGEVDLSTTSELQAQFDALPESSKVVVVDLSQVTFLDSTGLNALVSAQKRLRMRSDDHELRLVVTQPQILKVLEITGLSDVFPIFADVEAATAK